MDLINRGRAPESGRRAREGRLLALFNARPDAATAVEVALRRHGAKAISIEREWIDDMQAIRAAWPVAAQGPMNETWLRQVLIPSTLASETSCAPTSEPRSALPSLSRDAITASPT